MAETNPKILVTGATGYIGGRLVTWLVSEGRNVRAMARTPAKLDHRRGEWPGVEIAGGDVFDLESLDEALADVDTAFYLIHAMGGSGGDFASRDLLGAENFARAARRQGVRRIIYLGGLGNDDGTLSPHLRSRQMTGEALRSSGIPVTELRAAIIVGSGSASFEIIRDLVDRLPVMICPKWVRSRCEPIAIRQVLAYLAGCLDEPRTEGEILEIGGGEVMTYRRMLKQTADVMGRRVLIIDVPVLTPRLSSYWLHLVTEVPFNIARPLVEGLRNDVICQDFRIRQWIDVPNITFREAVALARERERTGRSETRWTDASMDLFTRHLPGPEQKPLEDERIVSGRAEPRDLFAVIQRIGGETGWYYGNWLWKLRGMLDRILGGIGMRRGRKSPATLRVGDPLDFWRVEQWKKGKSLVLRAEMKVPGLARLEFHVTPHEDEEGAFLVQKAIFWPNGLFGLLYWYAVWPLHQLIFPGMARNILRRAEKRTRRRRLRKSQKRPASPPASSHA